jgi:hypothetical protein
MVMVNQLLLFHAKKRISMHTESAHAKSASPEWMAFIAEFEAAEAELSQGRPAAFKALWSQSSDVSIHGALGGTASGWDDVATRLDWAGRQFSEGTRSREQRACAVGANLAHIAQTERIRYRIPGHPAETTLEFANYLGIPTGAGRMANRHRHADPLMRTQPPK